MKYKNLMPVLVALLIFGLLLIGCSSGAEAQNETISEEPGGEVGESNTVEQEDEDLLFVYVSPSPLGVNNFLLMGKTGLEAAGEQYGAEVRVYESEDPTTRNENVRAAVRDGADIVMVLGFEFMDVITAVSAEYPDTTFLMIDNCIPDPPENVYCSTFREYETTFLIGVVAAMRTETNYVGSVSGIENAYMHRYSWGFNNGVHYVDPDIEVDIRYVGGSNPFGDPVRAKELALSMHEAGADQLFTVTAGGDFGVFEAAEEEDFQVYAVDINWCSVDPEHIYTNSLKRVDAVIVKSVESILSGSDERMQSFGLKEGGTALSGLVEEDPENDVCKITENQEILETINELVNQIINGEFVVDDPMLAEAPE